MRAMYVLRRRLERRRDVIFKHSCRFFFDGKKTRFSRMQMALGGEQAGTLFCMITIPTK